MPKALAAYGEPINGIALHAFGDASGVRVTAAVYAVIQQWSGQTQGLVVAKVLLAKQWLTIPRFRAGLWTHGQQPDLECARWLTAISKGSA